MIVEVQFEGIEPIDGEAVGLVLEREDDLSNPGLTLDEGRALTEFVQKALVRTQADVIVAERAVV